MVWLQLEEAWSWGKAVREMGGRNPVGLRPTAFRHLPGFHLPAAFLDNSPY